LNNLLTRAWIIIATVKGDLLAETKPWVEKYMAQLEKIDQSEVDFSQSEWWH